MKILICLFLLLNTASDERGLTITKDYVQLSIPATCTEKELMKFKKDLLKKCNIQLDINSFELTNDGHIKAISCVVDCRDGFKGAFSTSDLQTVASFGFIRNYKKGVAEAFLTGCL